MSTEEIKEAVKEVSPQLTEKEVEAVGYLVTAKISMGNAVEALKGSAEGKEADKIWEAIDALQDWIQGEK